MASGLGAASGFPIAHCVYLRTTCTKMCFLTAPLVMWASSRGSRLECSAVGLDLGSSIDILRPIDVTFAMSQWHVAQEAGANISEDPRSCPSSGAALCTYQRWFRRGPTQEHVLGGSLHGHARSSSRAHQLLRFRLGCHSLPRVVGRRTGIPRHLRHCALCNQGVGDEKHLVFDCIALSHLRSRFQHLFWQCRRS
jgi:hypothetical protein